MKYVHELICQHGYLSELLLEGSIVFVLAKEIVNGDGCKLLTQWLQQGKALCTVWLLLMLNENVYGEVRELFYELHYSGIEEV